MSVPDKVRTGMKERLWEIADEIGWMNLSDTAKAKHYENWTREKDIGGVLGRYMDAGQVRVYLKDTLLKDYARIRLSDHERIYRVLGFANDVEVAEIYVKPHGRRLSDGRIICWGKAQDWKSILLAVYERTYASEKRQPFAAILLQASGKYRDKGMRDLVESAASKLCIERVAWVEM